ncbi:MULTISPECIES: hypothetical protein [unclassified Corynebacterium]|uniref:hypothetical protein n=1 Tax=unclassified Corynebacterium TaxID=2624378 RepID=UPI00216844EC|nr:MULTISPECIES: hypothetical protein [unclassified Corynebacterium]MCS4490373.1 hypothetical protein [Corynebacterium sp. ES2775-CONJ]MCS4492153.1 hypothetical protein [Corynebacterium sp. ES2715-CONJ3]
MKRFSAALMAAVTALSLSTAVAQANDVTSSTITDEQYTYWWLKKFFDPNGNGIHPGYGSALSSSEDKPADNAAIQSSLKNDAANDYRIGTTYTILWATGLTLTLVSILVETARANGLLPK